VSGLGRYWRAAVYDEFTGRRLAQQRSGNGPFGEGASLALPIFEARQPILRPTPFIEMAPVVLLCNGHPISLDRSAKARFNACPMNR